ncbi:MAG: inorganic phosphate transporter [Gammaproteobacteria bacterium]|nr:inorganic phosphate transporter [Gammaproteobacteria bacterium]
MSNTSQFNTLKITINNNQYRVFRNGTAFLFIVGIMLFMYLTSFYSQHSVTLMIAAMIGGYMAMNIGANDVANNVGPAVGARALTLTGAILIAVVFESAGALIAGGSVVTTIKNGIIDPALIADNNTFIWLMISALFAAALWLHIATWSGAPVSTTHSIVGGILGAGVAAGGWQVANLAQLAAIVASWVISPLMGGVIAAAFLYFIKRQITYQEDRLQAAVRVVPWLIMLMSWAFSSYLILKGLKKIWKVDFSMALMTGFMIALLVFILVRPLFARAAGRLSNTKRAINRLFTIPLIVSAALLSFAHGANDVANAVGPLAAINDAVSQVGNHTNGKAGIPLWVMIVGAAGIALGLMLYGPRMIKKVGSEITELDQMRAFCIAMSAAITVLIATQFGLPVSSTHIALGAIFGVGFLRESIKSGYDNMVIDIIHHHQDNDPQAVKVFLENFKRASVAKKSDMLKQLKHHSAKAKLSNKERKRLKKYFTNVLVKRTSLYRIIAAWLITVPASALMAAFIFYTIRGFMLT